MPRADWGGGNNLDSFFGSLFGAWESNVKEATARSVREAQQQQDAADADAYDKWKNGAMSDQDWLSYIADRVNATKGDPTEHEHWMELQRQHTVAIADAQHETAYSSGTESIHQLIAYYQGRLDSVDKSGPAYRDLISRYYQLVDQRDSNNLYDGAQAIIDRIERGKGTYKELLAFYTSALRKARPNSDLVGQLKKEINNIQDIVDGVTGGAGGSGGSSGGGGSRSSGGSGSGSGGPLPDQILQINKALIESRFGSYDPSGPDVISSDVGLVESGSSATEYLAALMGDINRINGIMDQYNQNPKASYFVDPLTGDMIPNNPTMIRALDNQMLRTQEMRFAVHWSQGPSGMDDATKDLLFYQDYVTGTMQQHYTDNVKPAWDPLVNSTYGSLIAASQIPDPVERGKFYTTLSNNVDKFIHNVTTRPVDRRVLQTGNETTYQVKPGENGAALKPEEMVNKPFLENMMYMQNLMHVIGDPTLSVDERQQQASLLLDQRPEGFVWTASDIERVLNGKSSTEPTATTVGVLETYAAQVGIQNGTWAYSGDGGLVRAVPMADIEAQNAELQAKNLGMVMTYEKINGTVQDVWRAIDAPVQNYTIVVDSNGNQIRASTSYTKQEYDNNLLSGKWKLTTYALGWNTVTLSDGIRWFQDPETHLWYRARPPIRLSYDASGNLKVGPDGKVMYEIMPMASAAGVIAPFGVTVAPRLAQQKLDDDIRMGRIDVSYYNTRDERGNAQFGDPNPDAMYWHYTDDAFLDNSRGDYFSDQIKRDTMGIHEYQQSKAIETWANRQEMKRKAEAQAWLNERMTSAQQVQLRKMNPDLNLTDYAQGLMGFAGSVGIGVGAGAMTKSQPNMTPPPGPTFSQQQRQGLPPVTIAPPAAKAAVPFLPKTPVPSVGPVAAPKVTAPMPKATPPPPSTPAPSRTPTGVPIQRPTGGSSGFRPGY